MFVTDSGEPYPWRAWAPGEPNNWPQEVPNGDMDPIIVYEDCMTFRVRSLKHNDFWCTNLFPFMCEATPPAASPTPSLSTSPTASCPPSSSATTSSTPSSSSSTSPHASATPQPTSTSSSTASISSHPTVSAVPTPTTSAVPTPTTSTSSTAPPSPSSVLLPSSLPISVSPNPTGSPCPWWAACEVGNGTTPKFPGRITCTADCAGESPNVRVCPREGSCLHASRLEDLTLCAPGHQGQLCELCAPGFAARDACGACQPCNRSGIISHEGVSALFAAGRALLSVGVGVVAAVRYARQPARLTTSLFSGALRIISWYIAMIGQSSSLAIRTPISLTRSAHTLQHWYAACGVSAPGTRDMQAIAQAERASGTPTLLESIFGFASHPKLASDQTCALWFDPSQSEPAMNLAQVVAYTVLLLLACVAGLTSAYRPDFKFPTLLVLLVAVYAQVLQLSLTQSVQVAGPKPISGQSQAERVLLGWVPGLAHFAAGTFGVFAMSQLLTARHASRRASPEAFLSKGYRVQLSPAQAVQAVVVGIGGKQLKQNLALLPEEEAIKRRAAHLAESAARADQAACCGFGRVFPTHAFTAVQVAEMLGMLASVWLITDIRLRLVFAALVVCIGLVLLLLRKPWCLAELNDLDSTAHAASLLQVLVMGVIHASPSLVEVLSTCMLFLHTLISLSMLAVVLRGYSGAIRRGLLSARRAVVRALPELGPHSELGEDNEMGSIMGSALPSMWDIGKAILVRVGVVRPRQVSATRRPEMDLLTLLHVWPEGGMDTVQSPLSFIRGQGAGLVSAGAASGCCSIQRLSSCCSGRTTRGSAASEPLNDALSSAALFGSPSTRLRVESSLLSNPLAVANGQVGSSGLATYAGSDSSTQQVPRVVYRGELVKRNQGDEAQASTSSCPNQSSPRRLVASKKHLLHTQAQWYAASVQQLHPRGQRGARTPGTGKLPHRTDCSDVNPRASKAQSGLLQRERPKRSVRLFD